MNNKKIVDCFRFFNEKELLELRYHILKDHVDKFIILQGNKTQSGNPCELLAEKYITELNLPREKFIIVNVDLPGNDEYVDTKEEDIIFRQLSGQSNDTYQNSLNARSRERILLDSLLTVVKDQCDTDVFLVSDCDEIIKPEYLNWFTDLALQHPNHLIKIPLVELQGGANLRAYSSETNQPISTDHVFFICTKKHFEQCTPFKMRFNINNPFEVVYITQDGNRIEECGWHFSWMGDSNRLKLKQKSTSHYADQIESAVIKDMASKELETYIDTWTPESGTNVWGDTRTIMKEYQIEKLPKEIFQSPQLIKFFLLGDDKTKIAIKMLNIVDDFDINGVVKDGGTDKFTTHSYLSIYSDILSPLVNEEGSLLELGTYHGGSLLLWTKLLKNFKIVGVDIYDGISNKIKNIINQDNHNVETIFTDAYNSETVTTLTQKYSEGFDIIVDDGPHSESSQIECLKLYFPLLKKNGVLIIEDIQDYDTVEKLKNTLDQFKNSHEYTVNVYDYRYKNNRYDDIVFTVKKINETLKPIPVIGVPIVNGVQWLQRLIDSIDYPVKELFIVNNNGRDQITDELDEITKIDHPFIEKIRVCHLPSNLGVSGAWNLIIKSYLMSPYWIICNNDVAFTPGFLKTMVEKSTNNDVEIVWPPSVNYNYNQHGLGSFECFLIKDSVVQKCGLFDENLYPAYCEDCDYLVKIKSNNIKSEYVYSSFYHGETESYETGSQTLKSESTETAQKIHDAHMKNIQYMNAVWGSDWENWENYSCKNITTQSKFYNINFNRQKYLGF